MRFKQFIKESKKTKWITARGKHIPIKDGESKSSAVKKAFKGSKGSKGSTKHISLYHGTTKSNADKIRQQGLKHGTHDKSSYFTSSRAEAMKYAKLKAGTKDTPTVLKINIPHEQKHVLSKMTGGSGGVYSTNAKIPTDWIK